MKKSSNKIFIFLTILVVIILIAGATVAYLFLGTDMFTDKRELMFKALGNQNLSQMLDTSKYYTYSDKATKNNNQMTTDVTMKLTGNNTESITNEIGIDLSNLSIRNITKKDINANAISNDTSIQYAGNDLFAFSVVKYGENIAIKSDEIVNKYVATSIENLENVLNQYQTETAEQPAEQLNEQSQQNQSTENTQTAAQETPAQTAEIQEQNEIVNIQRQMENTEVNEVPTTPLGEEENVQTIQEITGESNEINQVGKVLDFVLDLLIDFAILPKALLSSSTA